MYNSGAKLHMPCSAAFQLVPSANSTDSTSIRLTVPKLRIISSVLAECMLKTETFNAIVLVLSCALRIGSAGIT